MGREIGGYHIEIIIYRERERERERERANMHCLGIACTRSYYMCSTSAEGQKIECFKWTVNNIFICTMKI
jgi:hypothetical protein